MNYTIKNAKDLDPHTPVMALNDHQTPCLYLAGEIGEGPCVLMRDIKRALENAVPRSMTEVFDYIANQKLRIQWIDSLINDARKLVITSREGNQLYASDWDPPFVVSSSYMLRDGINFIMDMENGELNHE